MARTHSKTQATSGAKVVKSSKPRIITRVIHFAKGDLNGDYYDIELVEKGKTIVTFGDGYHDKGLDKSNGFIDGVRWATGEQINVMEKHVDDREE